MEKLLHTLFRGVLPESIKTISTKMVITRYKPGEVIHFNMDSCNQIDIILEGSVEVEHLNENGDKLIVRVLEEGAIIGLNIVFSSTPNYIMNFISRKDTRMASIKKENLTVLMQKDQRFMQNVMMTLSDNSLLIGKRIKDNFKVTIRQQLINYLRSLYNIQKQNPVKLSISKTELARHFGVSRTSVSRELYRMEQEGIVKVNKNEIFIRIEI